MKNVDIQNLPESPILPSQEHKATITLEGSGLSTSGLEPTNDTFIMDTTPSNDRNITTIVQNNEDNLDVERDSKIKKLVPPETSSTNDLNNAAFTNWYGIILTLIFSFAIGYLIAWSLLRMR